MEVIGSDLQGKGLQQALILSEDRGIFFVLKLNDFAAKYICLPQDLMYTAIYVQAGLLLHEALPAQASDVWSAAHQQGGGEQAEGKGR